MGDQIKSISLMPPQGVVYTCIADVLEAWKSQHPFAIREDSKPTKQMVTRATCPDDIDYAYIRWNESREGVIYIAITQAGWQAISASKNINDRNDLRLFQILKTGP